MGLFKSIKKAVKKITKAVTKPIKKVVRGAGGLVGAAVGLGTQKVKAPKMVQNDPSAAPAQIIEPPDKDNIDTEDESQTESGKKKTRAGGKKSLSVARNSGGGLNI